MEKIISFLPAQFQRENIFYVEMTGITYPDKNYRITRACSDIYCIEYVISGKGTVTCGGQTFFPQKGDVYLLPPGMRHDYYADAAEPYEKIWMNVRGSLCDFLYESYSLKGRFYFENCPMYSMFYRFLNFYSGCAQGTQEITAQGELLFHEMMADLYHWTIGMEPREKTIAENVKDYIDLHIDEKITVRQLCKNVGLSPAQLNRVFKKAYGSAPYQYCLSQKLSKASSMLRNTSLQVREISEKLSFADEHYFSSVFHEKTGMTPKEYRNRAGKIKSEE